MPVPILESEMGFVDDLFFRGEPVKFAENRCDGIILMSVCNEACCCVWEFLGAFLIAC